MISALLALSADVFANKLAKSEKSDSKSDDICCLWWSESTATKPKTVDFRISSTSFMAAIASLFFPK